MDPLAAPHSLSVVNRLEEPSLPDWRQIRDLLKRQGNLTKAIVLSLFAHLTLLGIAAQPSHKVVLTHDSLSVRFVTPSKEKPPITNQVQTQKTSDYSIPLESHSKPSPVKTASKTDSRVQTSVSIPDSSNLSPPPLFSWWQYQDENMGYFTAQELDELAAPTNKTEFLQPALDTTPDQTGRVLARVYINEHGGVDRVEILDATPPGIFEQAIIIELYRSSFTPAIKEGLAVKSQKDLEIQLEMPSQ